MNQRILWCKRHQKRHKDINNLKKSDTWNIHLTMAINFISSRDIDEEWIVHKKSDNIEIMTCDRADEVITFWIISF